MNYIFSRGHFWLATNIFWISNILLKLSHLVVIPDAAVELVPERVDGGVVEEVGGVLVKVLVAGVHEPGHGVVLVVHEQHLGQDVPGDVGVEVGVLVEQRGQHVHVDLSLIHI